MKHASLTADKNAELSQRWPRDAPYTWVPWKFSGVPDYAHGYFSRNFNGLLFRFSLWMCVQNLKFVAIPVPEIVGGTRKILGCPKIRLCSLFSKVFNGLLFGWTLWMYWQNLKSVPEIIGGTQKFWAVPEYPDAPFSPKFLVGFCSDRPCFCFGQIWSS